jgi:hypothetical protein
MFFLSCMFKVSLRKCWTNVPETLALAEARALKWRLAQLTAMIVKLQREAVRTPRMARMLIVTRLKVQLVRKGQKTKVVAKITMARMRAAETRVAVTMRPPFRPGTRQALAQRQLQ